MLCSSEGVWCTCSEGVRCSSDGVRGVGVQCRVCCVRCSGEGVWCRVCGVAVRVCGVGCAV